MLTMAVCQSASKSTVSATGASSLLWWKVLEERKGFLTSITTDTRSASLCLVLPPVGGARSAILLLEFIECFIGSRLFSNPEIQIQVCSPGRLDARRSALLAIGFYLGSDTLRRYVLKDLATSFAKNRYYPRGRRLVLYDAEGDFDRRFDWWAGSGKHRLVEPQLPFQ